MTAPSPGEEKPYIHDSAIVESGSNIGVGTKIWHFVHIREGATIGINTQIGKSCYIDSNVTIGDRCKIQNFVSLYNGVTLKDEVFVGPSAVFTNDMFPRAMAPWEITPTLVENGVSIGANATIVCGVQLGEYSMIGAGSVVTKDTQPYSLVVGNPARAIGWVCRCGVRVHEPSETCPHKDSILT